MTALKPWRGQSYLDELRPPASCRVDLALFATYSLDLSALGAALLALTGRGDEVGSGSIADFATAIEGLRASTRFIVQRGRITRPTRLPTVAGILDQFVVEVPYDETERSWHPKAALVRYVRADATSKTGDAVWRLWIGSRNLTRGADLEAGLMLETVAGNRRGGRRVAGVGQIGALLAARSLLPELEAAMKLDGLGDARWAMPSGISVESLNVAGEGEPFDVQLPAEAVENVTVVSPFLDATFLSRAAGWGGPATHRTLVSTRQALAAVAGARDRPLSRFERVLALDAPELPLEVGAEATDMAVATVPRLTAERDDLDPPPPSLHAKLFCFENAARATLLVGSANATSRAWGGRNAELLAELKGGVEITAGLAHLVGGAKQVNVAELEAMPKSSPSAVDELDVVRRRLVSTLTLRLTRDGHVFTVDLGRAPELPGGVALYLGLASSELLPLAPSASTLALGEVSLARQTDLIRFRLTSSEAAVAWMQRAPVEPPLDPGRDAAALSSLMGFGAFQSWIRQLLSGDPTSDDGPRWDRLEDCEVPSNRITADLEQLTLEDIVGSWGADKVRFRATDARFEHYCDALLQQDGVLADGEREALEELRRIWRLARERLPA